MSRRAQSILFLLGAAAFAWILSRLDLHDLWANAHNTGWWFVPIILTYGLLYALNSWSWHLMLQEYPRHPSYPRTFAITASAFTLNYMTPVIQAGGEPYKVAAVAPWMGTQSAVANVVTWRLVHSLSHVLSWLAALVLALFVLPLTPRTLAFLAMAGLLAVGAVFLLLAAHRQGVMERFLDVLHRLWVLDRLAKLLEPRRAMLVEMDRQIADFYHRQPRRFLAVLAIECVARAMYGLEFWLICWSTSIPISPLEAYVLSGLAMLVGNLLFFFPYEMGSKEAVAYFLFSLKGLPPSLGVYAAIVTRLRDLSWMGVGLLLIWGAGSRGTKPANEERKLSDRPSDA